MQIKNAIAANFPLLLLQLYEHLKKNLPSILIKNDIILICVLQLVDWRSEFTKWWCNEFKAVKFPGAGHVFNYYIDQETKRFMPWTDKVSKFELDSDIPLQVCSHFLQYTANLFK